MQLSLENGSRKIAAALYTLTFAADRPFAYLNDLNGDRIADLFYLSSIHTLQDRDDSLKLGSWQIEELEDEIILTLRVQSSIWEQKIIRFHCWPNRFTYDIEVTGDGRLAEVNYFGGYFSGQPRWGAGFFYSGQNFTEGFTPEPNSKEVSLFHPAEGVTIDMMGVPLPGKEHWFFTPPPFCYSLRCKDSWVGLGVEAQAGEYRFTEYSYHGRREAFHLSLSYEGHTQIKGRYQLPAVGFDFGTNEYEVLAAHIKAVRARLQQSDSAQKVKPIWWYEPIFCGWGAQCCAASLGTGKAPDYSRQDQYEHFLSTLESSDIWPGVIVLDDKWQATYGNNDADLTKWPDLPSFVQQQHQKGRKVLLWLKAWDPEGIPIEECITNALGEAVSVDPSNPAFEDRLRKSVRTMLSSEGYNADGFKVDFSARIPSGPGLRTYGDLWGLELMRRYLSIIQSEARQVKHDAMLMTHTPHPYLAEIVDVIRLNDINRVKDVNSAMRMRAKVASIACPDAIIDTDNWPITSKAAWRDYVRLQPELGVPSLYYTLFIDTSKEQLDDEDYRLIRDVWTRHRAKH